MPNTRNAAKALRQNKKRRLLNRTQRSTLRTLVKKFRVLATGQDQAAAGEAFKTVVKKLDQSASKGLIHKNTAARTKSRLAKLLHKQAAPAPAAE